MYLGPICNPTAVSTVTPYIQTPSETGFYKLWLANKANGLRQGLSDLAPFIKVFHTSGIHAGTKLFIAQ